MATENPNTADEPSLRDQLDAAFEEHATDEVDQPTGAPAAPAEQQPTDQPGDGRVRDEHGRFAPRTGQPPAQAPAGAPAPAGALPGTPGAPAPTTAPPPPELKAPASWRPEVREKWAGLDPEVRQEVHRREVEAQRVLQQTAGQRQFIEAFENVVRPYEMFIRQENSNPLQAVQNLMQTAAELRVGTPVSKAQLVAGMCKQYGIDMGLLDSALAGTGFTAPGEGGHQPQQPPLDPRFTQYLQQQQQREAQQAQQEQQHIRSELQAFAQAHEFYGDVAPIMADLIEVAAKRGEVLPIEQAYSRACKLHDGVSTILSQRAAAAPAAAPRQAVLRARRAAVSVNGASTPDGATVPKSDSVHAALEAAWDEHTGT